MKTSNLRIPNCRAQIQSQRRQISHCKVVRTSLGRDKEDKHQAPSIALSLDTSLANIPEGLHLPPALHLPPPHPHLAYSLLPTSQCGPWAVELRKVSQMVMATQVRCWVTHRRSLMHYIGYYARQKSHFRSTAKSNSERYSPFTVQLQRPLLWMPPSWVLQQVASCSFSHISVCR